MLNIDKRVLVLATARASGSFANSFLIILLPIYIGSTAVSLDGLIGIEILGVSLQKEFYIGLVLSLLGLVSSISQPFVGRFSDRTGKRKIFVLAGVAVLFVSTITYPIVSNYVSVLAVRIFQGIGIGMTVPAAVALVNEYSNDSGGRGESFGLYNTLRLIGFGIGPVFSGAIYSQGPYSTPIGVFSGVNAAFVVAALGALLSFILVLFFVEESESVETDDNEESGIPTATLSLSDPFGVSKINPILVLAVGTFLLAAAISMFATLEEPINQRLNQGSFIFSLQFSVGILANVIFQIPVGRYSDRTGRKRLIIAGFILLLPAMIGQAIVTNSILMFIFRAILGVSVAFVFPTSLALAGDIAGEQSGSILSALTAAFSLGVAIGPLSSGFLYNLGSYSTPFFVGAAGGVIALILSIVGVYEPSETQSEENAEKD